MRTLLIAGVLYLVTLPLWLLFVFPGMVARWGISIWFLYRIIKGMIRMNAGQSMENDACHLPTTVFSAKSFAGQIPSRKGV